MIRQKLPNYPRLECFIEYLTSRNPAITASKIDELIGCLNDSDGLNDSQTEGMETGLTREQVDHDWFGQGHAIAAKKGREYHEYQELDNNRAHLLGLNKEWADQYPEIKKLSREDVLGMDDDEITQTIFTCLSEIF